MAPITYRVVLMSGQSFQVEADTTDNILQLVERVAQVTGIPRTHFDLLPRGTTRYLSKFNVHSPVPAADRDLLLLYRPIKNRWLPIPNTTSITDPDEFRYHSRILGERMGERLARQQRYREQRSLNTIARNQRLPENTEGVIRSFLGGRKTRKAKKSRRVRTRKH